MNSLYNSQERAQGLFVCEKKKKKPQKISLYNIWKWQRDGEQFSDWLVGLGETEKGRGYDC